MNNKIIVILGTNASGKSSIGVELAKIYRGEIISADSRQIYKNFDLCSGKVTADEMQGIPHHLINCLNIGDVYSVADFQKDAYRLIKQIINRDKLPFIVGGTGLYIDSVAKGYILSDSTPNMEFRKILNQMSLTELVQKLDNMNVDYKRKDKSSLLNKRRLIRMIEKSISGYPIEDSECNPRYRSLQLGITWPKDILHKKIDERLSLRLKMGMIEEVESYINNGGDVECLYNLGLEYRYIYWYLSGKYKTIDEFYLELSSAIKRFAKRQLTWFKRNKDIIWLDMEKDYMKQATMAIDVFLEI